MCTVSFVSLQHSAIITSNRDENIQRQNAAAPAFHILNNKRTIFPKDAKAGGTWFAAANDGTVGVLLNGAFVKHIAAASYRKSRGLILLEIIEAVLPLNFFKEIDLACIEPFTLILYQHGSLHELRWDGNDKHESALSISGNYIWSSSTLYSEEVSKLRKNLFDAFITDEKNITAEIVRNFHETDHGDTENGFIINRQTGIKTFSITQAVVQGTVIDFSHHDLLHHKQFKETIAISLSDNKIIREEI